MKRRILIVEDEITLAGIVRDYLVQSGFQVEHLAEGTHAVEHVLDNPPDLIVLDIMLPGKDGLDICREVRRSSDVPIIMASARVEEIDRLIGLELGADDYICKPYSPREVVARVKTVLRRAGTGAPGRAAGPLRIDEANWSAHLGGQRLELTRKEFQLLAALVRRPGRVFSRAQLLDLAYGDDDEVYDRTIDSHIKNLRRKIAACPGGDELIRSVYGVGYVYDA
ncbi:MAG: hypothetical protein C0605_01655 [Hyphomicrobiales bacterium]|nr:MAG: hypothetical protein C0605_01655 [Hyphomicrobiales bacterium]